VHRSIRLAVFDVAGTTVLDGDAVFDCLAGALDPLMPVERSAVMDVMGLPKPLAIRGLLLESGRFAGESLETAVNIVHDEFRAAMIDRYRHGVIVPADGVERVFATLQASHIQVALDTGFSRDILDVVLERLGWSTGIVNYSVASDEVARGRPHPDLIVRAMELAGVRHAGEVIKIGDTPSDMEEGLAAGCARVVGVTYGTHTREQLARHGVEVIDALDELPVLLELGAD
jgi:phosphonatase-like hydrolase